MCLRLSTWIFVTGVWVIGLMSRSRAQSHEFAMHNYDDEVQQRTGIAELVRMTWRNQCRTNVTGIGPEEEVAILPATVPTYHGNFPRKTFVGNVMIACLSRINVTNIRTNQTASATIVGVCTDCESTSIMLSPAVIANLGQRPLRVGETFNVTWIVDLVPGDAQAKFQPVVDAALAHISPFAANMNEDELRQQTKSTMVKYLEKHVLQRSDRCKYGAEAERLLIRKVNYSHLMPKNADANMVEMLTLRYKLELEMQIKGDFCNHFQNLRCGWSGRCACVEPFHRTGKSCVYDLEPENRSCILNPQNGFSQRYDVDLTQPLNECSTNYFCKVVEFGTECESGYRRQQEHTPYVPAVLINSMFRFPSSEEEDAPECVCMDPRSLHRGGLGFSYSPLSLSLFSPHNTLEIDSRCDFELEAVNVRNNQLLSRLNPPLERSIFFKLHNDDTPTTRLSNAINEFHRGLLMILHSNRNICKTYDRLSCLPSGICGCNSNYSRHVEMIRQGDTCVLTRGSICDPAYWRGRFESYVDPYQEDADPPVCVQGLSCVVIQTGMLCPRNVSTPIVSFKYKVFPYLHNQFKKEPMISHLQDPDYCRCGEELDLSPSTGQNLWVLVPSLVALVVIVPVIAIWYHRRLQAFEKNFLMKLTEAELRAWEHGDQISEQAPDGCIVPRAEGSMQALALPYDKKLEIPMRYISYGEEKGRGGFGIVQQGRLTRNRQQLDVAIKKCQDTTTDNIKIFMAEIKIHSFIEQHENVIQLIGAITKNVDAPQLILEYCDRGTLEQVLQMHDRMFLDQIANDRVDVGFRGLPGPYDKVWVISTTNLLCWSYQVANGMQYLSVIKKIIHGDLFAKNVLISGNGIAKITDFGLSRKFAYDGKAYIWTRSGWFPHNKHLPPEARLESMQVPRMLSPRMDVWTFGILLWEVFTLGREPDCTETAEELVRPEYATSGIYSVIRGCWEEDPAHRPEFGDLRNNFQSILGEGFNPNANFEFGINFIPQREI